MWILQHSTMSYCVIPTHISNFYQRSRRRRWNVTAVFSSPTFLSRAHFSASFIPPTSCRPLHLWLHVLCSCSLLSSSFLPFLHPPLFLSICICCSLYVGTCIAVPLLVLGQLPHSSVLALVHPTTPPPHLPPPPPPPPPRLLLPVLHVCQGPGGSAQCTAQWPKSEYLRNCQLSPIIRGSP